MRRLARLAPTLAAGLVAFLAATAPATSRAETTPRELVLLNWSEYMDPELVAEFEKTHNAKVTQVYFETDDTRDEMVLDTGGMGYDVVLVNGISLSKYRKRGWLSPLTVKEVPNLRHVDRHWLDAFPDASGYAVPYFWGTLGIAYRKDLVPAPIATWRELFHPPAQLHGRIVMVKTSRDLIGMALKALGHSANSTDSAQIDEAEKLLMGQRPHVMSYSYVALNEESALHTGEAYAAMVYSGDALMLEEIDPRIAYVVPEEGSNLWVDYLVVMQSSTRKELARAFIDFLNEPANAERLAEFVHYATPNKAAAALLPAEFKADPVIYPPPEILNRSELYTPLPARVEKKRSEVFSHIVR